MSILYSRTQDGSLNVLAAGKVTRDAEIKQTQNASRVKFSICYDKNQFMDCEAFADSDVGAVAGCLEKGDTVAVMGKYRTWEYNGKTYSSVSVDMIFTLAIPMAAQPTDDPQAAHDAQTSSGFSELEGSDSELPF